MFPCPKAPNRGRAEGTLSNLIHYRVVSFLVVLILVFCFVFLCLLTIKKFQEFYKLGLTAPLKHPLARYLCPHSSYSAQLKVSKDTWSRNEFTELASEGSPLMRTSNRCTTWNLKKLTDGQTVRGLVTLCRMRRADGKVSKYVLQLTQIHRGKGKKGTHIKWVGGIPIAWTKW